MGIKNNIEGKKREEEKGTSILQSFNSSILKVEPAKRLGLVSEYYFSRKLKEVAQMNAEGKDIISLAIGSPDMPPSQQTIDKLCEVANNPNAHGYQPTMGTPELRNAMADFYRRWYGVELNPQTEVQPLIGSKEGILHVTLAFVNPGEQVLVPNPGYPTYTSLSKILGAEIVNYDLMEDNGFVYKLFSIKVKNQEGDINTTYHDYLQKHQKKAWWSYPIS